MADPPLRGKDIKLTDLVKAAKKEGKLNVIALPHDWANYGEIISTFKKKYGLAMDEANPQGSSSDENQAIRSLKGDSRAPDVVDVGPAFAIAGANEGLFAKYFTSNFKKVPHSMSDNRGFWVGDYWGAISFGVNTPVVSNVPTSWADLPKPEYRNKVALNGSPLTSGSAVAGVFSAALANGGSISNVEPGIEYFQKLKQSGNFIPIQANPQTIASGQTPIVIDWDYLNFAYIKEFPSAKIKVVVPVDRRVRGVLLPGDQHDGTAPVRGSAVAGVPLLRPGSAAVAQGSIAPGALRRPREAQGDPESAAGGTSECSVLCERQVRRANTADQGEDSDRQRVADEGRLVVP